MIDGTNLLAALPVAIYMTDAKGNITFYNESAAELWGREPELGTDKWCGSWRLFWPDGRKMAHEECPMALTLRNEAPVSGVEAIAERPDGRRVPFIPYPTLLRDEAGAVTGAINLLVDMAERQRADIERERLAAIVSSSDDAIVSKTLEGIVTTWNGGAERIFGYTPEEIVGKSITTIIPPELHQEEEEILARLRRGERVEHFDTVRLTKDGRRLDVSLTISPLRDRLGNVVGASKVARDVTERKRHEATQRLLLDELNHRVKNTLATVQAIASQSLARASSPQEFVSGFNGRVAALGRAHDLLVQQTFAGAKMRDLVREQVLIGLVEDPRIAISGPSMVLDAKFTVHMALILHELATNARKYGALAADNGRLEISWHRDVNNPNWLTLVWREAGVEGVAAPNSRGFGTNLIERSMDANRGSAHLRLNKDGFEWTLQLPLEAATGEVRKSIMNNISIKPQAGPNTAETAQLNGKRILIIEDEPLVALDIESHLLGAGCEIVGPAPSIERARELIENAEYDFVLIDANLHGKPVGSLAELLRARNVPFCFASGYGREGLPEGFGDAPLITKPFTGEALTAEIIAVLASYPEATF